MKRILLASVIVSAPLCLGAMIAAAQGPNNPNVPKPGATPSPAFPGATPGLPSFDELQRKLPPVDSGEKKGTPGAAAPAGKATMGVNTAGGIRAGRPLLAGERAAVERLRAYLDAFGGADEAAQLKRLLEHLLKGEPSLANADAAKGLGLDGKNRKTADPKGDLKSKFSQPLEAKGSDKDQSGPDLAGLPHTDGRNPDKRGRGGVHGIGVGAALSGSPVKNPSGQAGLWIQTGSEPPRRDRRGFTETTTYWRETETGAVSAETTYNYDNGGLAREENIRHKDGTAERLVYKWTAEGKLVVQAHTINGRWIGPSNPNYEETQSGKKPDSQPTEEGSGRAPPDGYARVAALYGGRRIACDFFGCRELAPSAGKVGDPGRDTPDGSRPTPAEVSERTGPGPGAATDPNPDDPRSTKGGGVTVRNPGSEDPCFGRGDDCKPGTTPGR